MNPRGKIVSGIVFGAIFCWVPLFVHSEENTNSPTGAVPAPASGFVTNQLPQVAPDDDSIDSLRKKAEAGNADAEWRLGELYANGTGVEKNVTEAAKWYRKAADQGFYWAQYNLAECYASGGGVEKNVVEAARWYQKAADQGVFFWMLPPGTPSVQFQLGMAYTRGEGVKKDMTEAAKWFRKSADEREDAPAQYSLGLCCDQGIGVEENPDEAVKLFRLAADQGYAPAQYYLGVCYAMGRGVEKSIPESAKWCRKSAEQGNALAQYALGRFYLDGRGLIKNEVEGLAWMYVASASGDQMGPSSISKYEQIYGATIIEAARQRATEIQAQIASHSTTEDDDPTDAILQSASAPERAPAPNTPKESGSGAFISADGLVLTAAHVIQGASRIEVVTATGTFAAGVVRIDAINDVALLKCPGRKFTPLAIASSKKARVGATVFTVGFPNIQLQGFYPKLTKGEISSETGFQDDPRQWQISVPTQPGNSGGPLCDENGNLIGIVESTLNPLTMAKVEGEIPQNVNYAVKSSYILPLLDDVQNLPAPVVPPSGTKFEDVVGNVQKSAVLILVY